MTLARAFRTTVAEHRDRVAVRTKDDEVSWTWSELAVRVDALAGGLAALGVGRGDTVALLLVNRPEFHVADLAVATLGATPFSIYATFTREQIEYVVSDAGARVGLIEAQFADSFPALEHVLALEDGWPSEPGFDPGPHWRAIEPDDLVTLIYTSGTTGPPKGVQLTHRNVMATIETTRALIEFPDGAKVISWLPAAHIAERMANHYLPLAVAMTITCCPDPRAIAAYLPAVRPTWFFAVPRIWEKLIGDGRPNNTALIVLDADFGPAWAAQQGIDGADLAALAHDERMRAAVQKGVDDANAKLGRVEQIKKFTLVEGDWLPGGDELTPTMKLKRKPIASKYAGEIAAMY